MSEPNETHVCGDINVDMYQNKWLDPDYPLLNLSRMIKSTCDVNNFYQLVKQVTRVQWNSVSSSMSMSCIDHVYTNSKHRCSEPSVTSFGGSDHDIISYVRYSKCPPGPSRVIWKRCYKNFDKQTFLEQLSLIDWSDVYHCTDVDSATECFTWKFSSLLNVHAPWLKVQHRKTFVPWLSKKTKELMIERDSLKRRAKSLSTLASVSTAEKTEAWNRFKKIRNEINNRKKREEILYKSEKLKESFDSTDILWRTAKSFMGWKTAGIPVQLSVDGQLLTSAKQIAQVMNNYFIEKVYHIRRQMKTAPADNSKIETIMQNKTCRLQFHHISVSKVQKLLRGLSSSKSTGMDGLDNFSVKLSAAHIAKPLQYIIELSRWQQKFPSAWKKSKIIPLHKKNDPLDKQNYRPVSLLSPLSKVLEKTVYEEFYCYF